MVRQRVIRESPTGNDVGTHGMTASPPAPQLRVQLVWRAADRIRKAFGLRRSQPGRSVEELVY
jgi:hypothetical protein